MKIIKLNNDEINLLTALLIDEKMYMECCIKKGSDYDNLIITYKKTRDNCNKLIKKIKKL